MSHLRIAAARDGFRRAGRAWTRKPVIVAVDEFDPEQLEQLRDDPGIDVIPCGPDGPEEADAPAGASEVRAMSLDEARRELIAAGVRGLDPAKKELWTAAGAPAVDALEDVTGLADIAAAERDAAWDAHAKSGAVGAA